MGELSIETVLLLLLLLMHQPTSALNKTQFMTRVNLLLVPALWCHSQGVFQIKRLQSHTLI